MKLPVLAAVSAPQAGVRYCQDAAAGQLGSPWTSFWPRPGTQKLASLSPCLGDTTRSGQLEEQARPLGPQLILGLLGALARLGPPCESLHTDLRPVPLPVLGTMSWSARAPAPL